MSLADLGLTRVARDDRASVPPQRRPRTVLAPPLVRADVHRSRVAALVSATLVVVDATAVLLAALPRVPGREAVVLASLAVLCFWAGGLYRSRLTLSVLDDLPTVLAGLLAASVPPLVVLDATGTRPADAVLGLLVLLAAVVLARGASYAGLRSARASGRLRRRALVVGAGRVGIGLVGVLQQHGELGLEPLGFVDCRPRVDEPAHLPAPLLGGHSDLATVVRDNRVDVVLVAFGGVREEELIGALRSCDGIDCDVYFIPRLFEMSRTTRDMDQAWGIPLVRVRRPAHRRPTWPLKRVLDVTLAGLALALLWPVLLGCALAVRWEGGSGVLFRQQRVGRNGREITVMKFRSLKPATGGEAATLWSITADSRMGPVGRFLRRTSLDELPQLWNVLTGSMSLVGPRPERPHFVEQFGCSIPRYLARHRVPAGLTGWAQVHGLRGNTSIQHRSGFDNYYIENWSLWGDVKIMLRTLKQVLMGKGG